LAHSRAADAAYRAFRWWERGQLSLLYPDGLPRIVREAIEYVHVVRTEWQNERDRLLAIEAKRQKPI